MKHIMKLLGVIVILLSSIYMVEGSSFFRSVNISGELFGNSTMISTDIFDETSLSCSNVCTGAAAGNDSRVDTMIETNCTRTDKYSSIYPNGTLICTADQTGSGGNSSWNQSYADTLYADISVTGDNTTWNQSYADTLYAAIGSGGNTSWNQSYADTLYAALIWGYNHTLITFASYSGIWNSTFNATYDAKISDNTTWNQSRADGLYADISVVDTNESERVNNAASFTCTGNDFINGFELNLTPICDTPLSAGGGASKWIDKGTYIEPNSSFARDVFVNGTLNGTENITVDGFFIGDGSLLTGISTFNTTYDAKISDNTSWNQSYADTLYATIGSGGNTSWNQSRADGLYADIIWGYNHTLVTFASYSGIWNSTFNATYDAKVSDNTSWNQSYADTLYSAIGSGGNTSWNQSYADTLYADISVTGDNTTWNQSRADGLYADIIWSYNHTLVTFASYSGIWNSTFNATYDAKISDNTTWNQSRADGLYADISVVNTDTNASTACNAGEHLDGDLGCLNTNDTIDARTASTTYNASSIVTVEGTLDAGNITSIQLIDGDWYNVSENAGGSPLLIDINFTGVVTFSNILLRSWYVGGLGHEVEIFTWNYNITNWESHGVITDQSGMVETSIVVLDASDHVSGGLVQLRFDHVQNGVSSHDFFIDYVALQQGFTSITNAVHDSLLGRDETDNHPWAFDIEGNRTVTKLNVSGDTTSSSFTLNGTSILDWIQITNTLRFQINESQISDLTHTIGDNTTWNQSRADGLYAALIWGYNHTLVTFASYSGIWNSTFNATYDAKVSDNTSWNQSYADTLYADISVTGDNTTWNQSRADGLYIGVGSDQEVTIAGENVTSGTVADAYVTDDLTITTTKNASFSRNITVTEPSTINGLVFTDYNATCKLIQIEGGTGGTVYC